MLGSEYGIVVLTTVRSNEIDDFDINRSRDLGFITDQNQINVGITRCKYGLIIIGE